MGTYLPTLLDTETEILSQYSVQIKTRNSPIIAIGGFSGTGKDTTALFVQQYYKERHKTNLNIIGAGILVRQTAKDLGYDKQDLELFTKSVQTDPEFALKVDREIERRTLKTALLEGGIFLGRMTPFVVGDWGLTIWLEVAARVIAERISYDEARPEFGLNEAIIEKKIRLRDLTDGDRLEKTYQISFREAKTRFDLTLRNEDLSKEELEEKIYEFLEQYNKIKLSTIHQHK